METAGGGLCLTCNPLIHSSSSIHAGLFCYCTGQHPVEMMRKCGGICRSFDSLPTSVGGECLLILLPTCQLHQMTAFGA